MFGERSHIGSARPRIAVAMPPAISVLVLLRRRARAQAHSSSGSSTHARRRSETLSGSCREWASSYHDLAERSFEIEVIVLAPSARDEIAAYR